ncbi:M1 family metallopeptidase [Aureivirga sp. CE67]|uniref:M1 family metallopeptidase n=1 Tax=Aureivirga sp. CE67 TaxID=1788983 RepID=UPI0018C9F3AA|nr:M1 family metallopeptidase [Aureivirga sp. CE67]
MKKNNLLTLLFLALSTVVFGQKDCEYWQQHVDYTMDIDVDHEKFQYKGKQKLVYTNNSPDALDQVFYHLYFNAFQPGSEMDLRLQNIEDPDKRMMQEVEENGQKVLKSRISLLNEDQIGFIKVNSLTMNGKAVNHKTVGTVLQVTLNEAIQPGTSVTFEMEFDAQIPEQIRRSGRNSKEGVAFSMTQWYPKMAEYDFEGWHADPYIGREFFGVWGNFDVTLHLNSQYIIGGTGVLQNANEIGYGYEDKGVKVKKHKKKKKLSWNFKAENVHDFAWAADKDYTHEKLVTEDGIVLHFLFKSTMEPKFVKSWMRLPQKTADMMKFFGEKVGKYPYPQYTVVQGGDGGMEYAQCTLITGERSYGSLVGVTAHELAHSWFQHLLGTNESKYPWMDEGFTTYISTLYENMEFKKSDDEAFQNAYGGYMYLVRSGKQEALSTHGDRYSTNLAYGIGSYTMGSLFLAELEYIIGEENLDKTLKEYYNQWKFKHPNPNDFKRVAEKVSGIQLDWFLNEWTQTTHTIDYSIKSVNGTEITLERVGAMPMPIDIAVVYEDGTSENFNIPLRMMLGSKPTGAKVLEAWAWAIPTYTFNVSKPVKEVIIDPAFRLADVNRNTLIYKK